MLESEIHNPVDDGRAFDRACHVGIGIGEVEQANFGYGQVLVRRLYREVLSDVARAVA